MEENPVYAFPFEQIFGGEKKRSQGMTLRDWFAGQAMAAMNEQDFSSYIGFSKHAYAVADAMMKERNK